MEKRELTIDSDFDHEEFLARRAEEKAQWPENELRLAKLEVNHKITGSNLTVDQLMIVTDLIDTLCDQNKQQDSNAKGFEE